MATATLVRDQVPGYPGLARLYRLDPPLFYNGIERDHALVWIRPPGANTDAAVSVIPATSRGIPAEGSLRERPGSFTAHGNPLDNADAIDGACRWALASAGQLGEGYMLGEAYTVAEDPA